MNDGIDDLTYIVGGIRLRARRTHGRLIMNRHFEAWIEGGSRHRNRERFGLIWSQCSQSTDDRTTDEGTAAV